MALGVTRGSEAGTQPQKTPQQQAYEAEIQRQKQIDLQNQLQLQQGTANINTSAARDLEGQRISATRDLEAQKEAHQSSVLDRNLAADASKQSQAFAEAQRSQGAGFDFQKQQQAAADQAARALQDAKFSGQGGLDSARAVADLKAQQEAEAHATAQQGSSQTFQSDFLKQQAQIQQEAEARRMAALQGLLGGQGVGGGGMPGIPNGPTNTLWDPHPTKPGSGGGVPPGGGGTPQYGTEDAAISAQEDEARNAAFARAKDQAGLIGRSALAALQDSVAGRGMGAHSGAATSGTGQVINQGANQLGEVNREQAINSATNARQRASERLSDSTTRRGQNLAAISGLMNSKAY